MYRQLLYLCCATASLTITSATVTAKITFISATDATNGAQGTPCLRRNPRGCLHKYVYCADLGILPTRNCKKEDAKAFQNTDIGINRNKVMLKKSGLIFPVTTSYVIQITDKRISRNSNNDFESRVTSETGKVVFTRRVPLLTGTVPNPKINIPRTFRVTWEYEFTCDANFYTKSCDVYCEPKDDDVNGHYTCNNATGEKTCLKGYFGEDCKKRDRCYFEKIECGAHGECCVAIYSHTTRCCCDVGYTGALCNIKCDGCASNPCQNGETCMVTETGYNCTAYTNYTSAGGSSAGGSSAGGSSAGGSSSGGSSSGGSSSEN